MELDILVVEGEPSIVRMLEPTLQASGARVVVAWSGSQALEYIAAKPFDVVLCDLGLPDIDGKMLIPKIRELCDASIIVLSARGMEHDKITALDAGADDPTEYQNEDYKIHRSAHRVSHSQAPGHVIAAPAPAALKDFSANFVAVDLSVARPVDDSRFAAHPS